MGHKKEVNKQIALGFIVLAILALGLWSLIPNHQPGNRVEYTLSWLAVFSIPLFLGIHPILFRRYNSADLIKGYNASESIRFEQAYLSNTVEQTAVNVLTVVTLGMVAPLGLIKLVPIQAIIYVIGRVLFYFSYRANSMKRFVGFVLGYYVAVGSLLLSVCFVISGNT